MLVSGELAHLALCVDGMMTGVCLSLESWPSGVDGMVTVVYLSPESWASRRDVLIGWGLCAAGASGAVGEGEEPGPQPLQQTGPGVPGENRASTRLRIVHLAN